MLLAEVCCVMEMLKVVRGASSRSAVLPSLTLALALASPFDPIPYAYSLFYLLYPSLLLLRHLYTIYPVLANATIRKEVPSLPNRISK